MKKPFLCLVLWITGVVACTVLPAQKLTFDVILFGKKIGETIVERIEKGNGLVQYKLNSSSEVTIFFTKKTSEIVMDVLYKDGKLFSSYVKNVKDGIAEVVTISWQDSKYMIKRGDELLQITSPIVHSAILLYFNEPTTNLRIFSERLGRYYNFLKTRNGEYECKTENAVNNIYRYKNGKLFELEMQKGASVFMRPIE